MSKNYPVIAAQMYTVRDFMNTDEQFTETLNLLKETGFKSVQLSGHTKVSVDVITEAIKRTGLKVCCTHIGFERFLNDFENVVKEHKAWGCDVIGIGGMPGKYTTSAEGYMEFAKEANKVSDMLAPYGMKFAYHNHSHEFRKFNGVTGMDIFLQNTNDSIEFIPDIYWLQNAGISPYGWLKKIAGRVSVVHYKDMKVTDGNNHTMCEIGQGNIDFVELNEICKDIGVKYAAIEQDVCERDSRESLKMSYDYLASTGLK